MPMPCATTSCARSPQYKPLLSRTRLTEPGRLLANLVPLRGAAGTRFSSRPRSNLLLVAASRTAGMVLLRPDTGARLELISFGRCSWSNPMT